MSNDIETERGGVSTRKPEPWPQGQPTRACTVCHGTGLSTGAVRQRVVSRDPNETKLETLRCSACAGRGRVIAEGTTS